MYNRVVLIGRLTAQPQVRKTVKERSVCQIRLAVNRRYKSADGKQEADFVSITFWGRLAETLGSYGSKGSLLTVEGELRTDRYEKDGQQHYTMEVLGQSFQFLESRSQREQRQQDKGEALSDLVLEAESLPF
ncbi:single-stranded DNA-binding protein [Streptococcus sp. DD12]|uniref:single-stranded DNA-binding protein n=1 Tax=Streptococcus sp. DD12 TaxID=1777880 RepID=UPI00079B62C0|nr:single-stranded DNA-binding protein [Streptococcus sp. DD12]KXT75880.1 tRNA-binding protein [Streptococcus sp. DD12]